MFVLRRAEDPVQRDRNGVDELWSLLLAAMVLNIVLREDAVQSDSIGIYELLATLSPYDGPRFLLLLFYLFGRFKRLP